MVRAESIALFSERLLQKELKEERYMKLAEGEAFQMGLNQSFAPMCILMEDTLDFRRACLSIPPILYINTHGLNVGFYDSIDVLIDDRR